MLIEFTRLVRQSFKASGGHRPLLVARSEAQTAAPQSNRRLGDEWHGCPSAKLGRSALPSSPSLLTDGAARRLTLFQAARSVPETVCPMAPLVRTTRATARI